MSRRKANIRAELVGELFLKPGEDIPYRLTNCEDEPTAIMERVDSVNVDDESPLCWPISQFKDFVLLKPVRPVEKLKIPRSDKGKSHKKSIPLAPVRKIPGGEGEIKEEK